MVIDEEIVVLGSYNFTNSAETRNDETLVVIYSPEIAAQFMSEFIRVHTQAQEGN
jgi:phosphatidylserine/phosphatidylglycerophosphate/cardiolipin synthase-like enzyme